MGLSPPPEAGSVKGFWPTGGRADPFVGRRSRPPPRTSKETLQGESAPDRAAMTGALQRPRRRGSTWSLFCSGAAHPAPLPPRSARQEHCVPDCDSHCNLLGACYVSPILFSARPLSTELAALRVLWQRMIWLLNGQTHWSRPAAAGPLPVRIALRVLKFVFLPGAILGLPWPRPTVGRNLCVLHCGLRSRGVDRFVIFHHEFLSYYCIIALLALLCYFGRRAAKPCC